MRGVEELRAPGGVLLVSTIVLGYFASHGALDALRVATIEATFSVPERRAFS